MGKYIEKQSLPCFKYLNVLSEDEMNCIIDDLLYFKDLNSQDVLQMNSEETKEFLQKITKCASEYSTAIFKDSTSLNGLPKRLKDSIKELSQYDIPKSGNLVREIYSKYVHKTVSNIITECRRLLQIDLSGHCLQGLYFPVDWDENGDVLESFPKLLLIEEGIYEEKVRSFDMDFHKLFRTLYRGVAYNSFIQTEKKPGKYGLCIRRVSGDTVRITLLDRICSGYTFELKEEGPHSYSLRPTMSCSMRDGSICPHSKQIPCVLDEADCPTKKLPVVRAVLLCLQEYLQKKENAKPKESSGKTATKESGEKFYMEGMISVFDYYDHEGEIRFRNKNGTHKGYKVCPHVRSSHMRHLKNGSVVPVKASVVHRDEYEGYMRADRLNA